MEGGLSPDNSNVAAAFKSALLGQGVIALAIFVALAIAWVVCRELLPMSLKVTLRARQAERHAEPAGRRLLRIGFGALWIIDAILQAQPAMPGGLPAGVIAPAAAGSPGWVQHLVVWAGNGWSAHPVADAAGAVWVQLGIGVWLIACAHGQWSRLAGLASVGWGLVVWVFGEAFGSILRPGLSILTGAPGGALFYVAAGALIALPERSWQGSALGRRTLQAIGAGLAGFAVLQAWPGRGFWQGTQHGKAGSLAAMVRSMAATAQPRPLSRLVADFGALVTAHGFAVNLAAVLILAAGGTALLTGKLAAARPAVAVLVAFFLADWVLVQDLGFFGGLGTDPNSMLPLALLTAGGLVAMVRPPTPAPDPASARPARTTFWIGLGTVSASFVVALWAAAVVVLGAAPMAAAALTRG
jgi:hypothetical protein